MSQFLIHKTTTCLDCSGTGIVVRPTLAGLPQNSIEPQTCLCLLCAGEGIEHREMELHQAMQDAEFRALVIEFLGGKAT